MEEHVLTSKLVNALVEDATSPLEGLSSVGHALERTRGRHGGLWVGGRATLTDRTLGFAPNGVNRAVNSGTLEAAVDLKLIERVDVVRALVTNIVDVHHAGGLLRLRCFGAKRFAGAIRAAAAEA